MVGLISLDEAVHVNLHRDLVLNYSTVLDEGVGLSGKPHKLSNLGFKPKP